MALSFSEADGDGEDSVALTVAQAMLALAVVAATALALHWLGSGSEQDKDAAKQSPECGQPPHPQDRAMVQTPALKAKVGFQGQNKVPKVMPSPEEPKSPKGKEKGPASAQARALNITSRGAPPKQPGGDLQPSCGLQSKAGASPGPGPLLIHFTPRHPETWSKGRFGVREEPSLLAAAPAGEKPSKGQGPVGQRHDMAPGPRARSRVRGPGPDPFTLGTVVSVWDAIDAGSSLVLGDPLRGGLPPQALGTRISAPAEALTVPAPEEKWAPPPESSQATASRRGGGEAQVSQGESKPLPPGAQTAPTAVQEGPDSKSGGREPGARGTGLAEACPPNPAVGTPEREQGWPWKERELLITSSFSRPPNTLIQQLVASGQGSSLPVRKETMEAGPAPRQISADPEERRKGAVLTCTSPGGTGLSQASQVPSSSPGAEKPGSGVMKGPGNNVVCEGGSADAQTQGNSSALREASSLGSSTSSSPCPRARRIIEPPSSVMAPGASLPLGSPSSTLPPPGSPSSAPSLMGAPSSEPPPTKAARPTEFPSSASSSIACAPTGSLCSAPAPTESLVSTPAPIRSPISAPAPVGSLTSAAPTESPPSAPALKASRSTPVPTVSPSSAPVPTVSPSSAPVPTVSPSSAPVPTVSPSSAPVPTTSPSSGFIPTESLSSAVPPRAGTLTGPLTSGPSSILSSTGPASSVHTPSTQSSPVAAPSEPLPSPCIPPASLPKDSPCAVQSVQISSKAQGQPVCPGLAPAPGGQSVRALSQGPSGNWGNLISMVLRSHPFPSPEKPWGEAPRSSPAEWLGPAAGLIPGANTVAAEPQAKVRDQPTSKGSATPGTVIPRTCRGLNGAQAEEQRMDTSDAKSTARGPSPPPEPLGQPRLAPERKQPEPAASREAVPDAQPAPRPRRRSVCRMADSLAQKVSQAAPSPREALAGSGPPLTERQLWDSQLMAFLKRPRTWGTAEGRRKPSQPHKDLPGTVASVRRHLDLGSCAEALAFAQQHGELALAEEVYALMSDNFLLVLGDTPLYRQLGAGDRDRILALRTTRGQAVLGVLVLPSAYGGRPGLSGGGQAAEMPAAPSAAPVPRTYLHVFEPGRNAWLPLTLVPEEVPLRGCGLCTMHNYLFVAGGIRGSGPGAFCTNEVFCYNPLTDIWTQVRPMLQARAQLKLVALEGFLYAIGGECLYSMECYDPRTDHWTSRAPLPAGTFPVAHEAVACRGDIYVTGGHLFYRLLKYSPLQDCWAECPYSASHRRSSDMVALGGFLYRFDLLRGVGAAVMRYNTVTGSWSQAAPLPLPEPIPLRCAVLGNTIYCLNQQVTATFTVAEGTAQFESQELKPFPMGGKGVLCPFTLTLPAVAPLQTPL